MKLNYNYTLSFNRNSIESNRKKDFSTTEELKKGSFNFKKPYEEGIDFRIGLMINPKINCCLKTSDSNLSVITIISLIKKSHQDKFIKLFELDNEDIEMYNLDKEKVMNDFNVIYNELLNM